MSEQRQPTTMPEMAAKRLFCPYCSYQTRAWQTYDGKQQTGMAKMKRHIESAHPKQYRKIYGEGE